MGIYSDAFLPVSKEERPISAYKVRRQLMEESKAMAEHAFAHGLDILNKTKESLAKLDLNEFAIPPSLDCEPSETDRSTSNANHDIRSDEGALTLDELMLLHTQLSAIVYPAKPHTLRLFAEDRVSHPLLHTFGDCPLIRKLGVVCIVSLVTMLVISLSPLVDGEARNFSLTESSGMTLLINELFLLSAASLGAAFSALFRLSHYIVEGSYDTKYDADYWAKYMLGVISGAILALMIPVHEIVGGQGGGHEVIPLAGLAAPLLALLGGFSSSLVHRVLNRLVLAFETVLRGDVGREIEVKNLASKSQADQRNVLERQQWGLRILRVMQRLYEGADKETITSSLEEIMWQISGGEFKGESGGSQGDFAPAFQNKSSNAASGTKTLLEKR